MAQKIGFSSFSCGGAVPVIICGQREMAVKEIQTRHRLVQSLPLSQVTAWHVMFLLACLVLVSGQVVADEGAPAVGETFTEMPEPLESQSSASLRVNRTMTLPLQRWFPGADNAAALASLQAVRQRVNSTYLQCLFHMGRMMRVARRNRAIEADFVDIKGHSSSLDAVRNMSVAARWRSNPCGFQFASDTNLFSGIDSLVLVGDSTILRDFQHILHAPDHVYFGKVIKVEKGYLNSSKIVLSSGRVLPVHFFRLLYTSMVDAIIENIFSVATRNSLIIVSLGPHDTSWLVFNKPMPGFPPKKLHNWDAGQAYWIRNAQHTVNQFARRLRAFEENLLREEEARGPSSAAAGQGPDKLLFRRPVVVFRDMFTPNCQASKFVRRPEVKCEKLLVPIVVPFYRRFLRAHLAAVNIPSVSMEQVMPPCYLMDAGHLIRKCKRIELQLFAQAFRMTRLYNVQQGFPLDARDPVYYSRKGQRTSKLVELPGVGWKIMSKLTEFVQPYGYPQDDPAIDTRAWAHLRGGPLVLHPASTAEHPDTKQLLGCFYDAARIEKEPGMQDTTPLAPLYYVPRTSVPLVGETAPVVMPIVPTPTEPLVTKAKAQAPSSPLESPPQMAAMESAAPVADVAAPTKADDSGSDMLPPRTGVHSLHSKRERLGQLPWMLLFVVFAGACFWFVR